ncbi:MAG: hypothetical protein ACUVSX_14990 [Aggregatilineales bacterium]
MARGGVAGCYMRDTTMQKDRFHGRVIGLNVSSIRNATLNLLRTVGTDYIPDARCHIAALPDLGFHLLC